MAETAEKLGMGWLPDYPDFRDYTVEQDEVAPRLKRLGQKASMKDMLTKVRTHQKLLGRQLGEQPLWLAPL